MKRFLKSVLGRPWVARIAGLSSTKTLVVLAYHRVRRCGEITPLADSLFSVEENEFAEQVAWLAKNTTPVSESDVLACIAQRRPFPNRASLVTFDDGYRDNFTIAAPILKQYRVPAIYFIATGPMSGRKPFWWDEIAWAIKQTKFQSITVVGQVYDLTRGSSVGLTCALISHCLALESVGQARFMDQIRRECGVDRVPQAVVDAALMTWDQVQTLGEHGISVGAHTVNHCVLSRLDAEARERELRESKAELELRTGREVLSVAYPFGGEEHFDSEAKAAAQKVGFRMGFGLVPGINRVSRLDQFSLSRIIPPADIRSFALWLTMPRLMLSGRCHGNGTGADSTCRSCA